MGQIAQGRQGAGRPRETRGFAGAARVSHLVENTVCSGFRRGEPLRLSARSLRYVIRVRFHGRGGHGVKTASRILGSAGFKAGYEAQDSPVYGAERRGAAVTAFTRISERPIHERGAIGSPDIIVLGDETLLRDPTASVLAGRGEAGLLFVNTTDAAALAAKHGIDRPVSLDLTAMTAAALGRASALSVGLGAASARLTGCVGLEDLLAAVEEELKEVHLSPEELEKSLALAREVYESLEPANLSPAVESEREPLPVTHNGGVGSGYARGYDGPVAGSPSILATGNSTARLTGSWRLEKPEIDRDLCTRCSLCLILCPDGAVELDDEGYPVIDYEHCKGCMICEHVCPIRAIAREQEVKVW